MIIIFLVSIPKQMSKFTLKDQLFLKATSYFCCLSLPLLINWLSNCHMTFTSPHLHLLLYPTVCSSQSILALDFCLPWNPMMFSSILFHQLYLWVKILKVKPQSFPCRIYSIMNEEQDLTLCQRLHKISQHAVKITTLCQVFQFKDKTNSSPDSLSFFCFSSKWKALLLFLFSPKHTFIRLLHLTIA